MGHRPGAGARTVTSPERAREAAVRGDWALAYALLCVLVDTPDADPAEIGRAHV